MSTKEFLQKIQHDEIVAAIRLAEEKTSGEIRVLVSHKNVGNVIEAAQKAFERLGMVKTHERNGVLIFVAPRARKFAVIGDKAVHERCGDKFWQELASEMSHRFAQSEFQVGITHAIKKAGALLADHFPPTPGGRKNELSDEVAGD